LDHVLPVLIAGLLTYKTRSLHYQSVRNSQQTLCTNSYGSHKFRGAKLPNYVVSMIGTELCVCV